MAEADELADEAGAGTGMTAAEVLLRSLGEHGVSYVFGNFGTDHPPILEAAARVRAAGDGDAIPEFVICPHESVALSAAHGYAVATGEPQAVIVHVDVGTQNLGAMVHDAHRGDAPVFVFAGLAPVSNHGHPGSRSSGVHFVQDVYDQPGIVRDYCRWTREFRLPGDPDELVTRGLELATSPRRGPVYLSAAREALEAEVETQLGTREVDTVRPTPADPATVEELASTVAGAEAPVVVTSKLGSHRPADSVSSLVEFAETAGAGVVESGPIGLCFPRTHELHAGFSTRDAFERADLVVLADIDVPWVPAPGSSPPADVPVVQLDLDPSKPEFPQWDLRVDRAVQADPAPTLAAVADRLDPADGAAGRETWRAASEARTAANEETVAAHRGDDRLTAAVLSDAVDGFVDESTTVVNETTTNNFAVLSHVDVDRPGGYLYSGGSGLGWAPGAAIGAKLARPDERVICLVGDGSYVFGHPTASAWVAGAFDAPTLTVVYNNSGWNAVKGSTVGQHPEGSASVADVPESKFDPTIDLSHAAHAVDAHSAVVAAPDELEPALRAGVEAVESGKPSVVDVRIEPI